MSDRLNMNSKKNKMTYHRNFSFIFRHRIILPVFFVLCLLMFSLMADLNVVSSSKGRLYYDINDVPHRRAALVSALSFLSRRSTSRYQAGLHYKLSYLVFFIYRL